MIIPPFKPKLLEIAESEQTPLVQSLLQIIAEQQEQIQRLVDEALAVEGLSFNFFRVRYKIEPATVSFIIPTRDRVDLLGMSVESLLGKTRLPAGVKLKLIVVNNGSSQPDTLAYFAELEERGH